MHALQRPFVPLGLLLALVACATAPHETGDGATMPVLDGEAAIDRFARKIDAAADEGAGPVYAPPPPAIAPGGGSISVTASRLDEAVDTLPQFAPAQAEGADESITNTQEAGVDEGGIVKRHGDHLVILRRGRLFTVDIAGEGLRAVDAIDAFPPNDEDPDDTWYDEMLVAGDTVIVIGYSYGDEGSEISRFDIGADGKLAYRDTHYVTSGDYYSSRNYASRLIGDRLLLYSPLDFFWDDWRGNLPVVRQRRPDGTLTDPRRSLGAMQFYVPQRYLPRPSSFLETLHTVTSCELARPDLQCRSTIVVGAYGATFYFSPTATYVWTDNWEEWAGDDDDETVISDSAMLFRIPLDGSSPSAVAVYGSPVDQFAFRENPDRSLDVLVRSDGAGGRMWAGEFSADDVALLHLAAGDFGDGGSDAPEAAYRRLPPVEGYRFFNRFVGRHVLYAGGAYGREEDSPQIFIVPLDRGWVQSVALPHGITRFDALGADAVAIGPDGADALGFSSIVLDADTGAAQLANTYLILDAEEGETRSQALFYRPDPDTPAGQNGTLGLPVSRRISNDAGEFLGDASAIAFLRREDRKLRPAGMLDSSTTPAGTDDGCQASCVDWYGNARPIFIGERIFALMGYEIVEGALVEDRIVERRRLDFAPRQGKGGRQP